MVAIFSFRNSPFALTWYWSGSSISFLALLISARTLLGLNSLSSKFSSLIQFFINVFWSLVSNMIKELSNPILSMNLLKILTHMEWKVPIHMSLAGSPTRLEILSFISLAALLVKVMAMMSHGFACFSPIK